MLFKNQDYTVDQVQNILSTASASNGFVNCNLNELKFSVRTDGEIEATLPSGKKYTLTKVAEQGICSETRIPYSYYSTISPELKLYNITRRISVTRPRNRRVEFNDEHNVIRGIVPESYHRILTSDMLADIDPNSKIRPMFNYDDDLALISNKELDFRLLLDTLDIKSDTSENNVALNLRYSELGGFYHAKPSIYRQICTNGAVLQSNDKADSFKMSYSSLDSTLAKSLTASLIANWKVKIPFIQNKINELTEKEFNNLDDLMDMMKAEKVPQGFLNDMFEQLSTNRTISDWDVFNMFTSKLQEIPAHYQLKVEQATATVFGLTDLYLQ